MHKVFVYVDSFNINIVCFIKILDEEGTVKNSLDENRLKVNVEKWVIQIKYYIFTSMLYLYIIFMQLIVWITLDRQGSFFFFITSTS